MKSNLKKTFITLICLLLAFSTLFLFAGCALNVAAEELSAGYRRASAQNEEIGDGFTRVCADFSVALAKAALADKTGGGVSPISALYCLGLIAEGTSGDTRASLERALGTDVSSLARGLRAFGDALYSGKDCKVQLANSLWINDIDRFTVNEQFLQNNADYYDAQVYRANFDDRTVKDLNNWVKKNTDGMIDKIIDSFDENDLMYLVNTLLFDAKWENKYESGDVKNATFNNYNGTTSSVKMLHSEESRYVSDENAQGFLKEYAGRGSSPRYVNYAFLGLLPNEGVDVYEYLASLDGEKWTALMNSWSGENVKAGIPEFTVQSDIKLKKILSDMGYAELFDVNADLSALGSTPDGIYLSDMQQKLKIEVDRNGTKAAAVTWGVVGGKAINFKEHRVILDRPFIYAIVDLQTGLPLFFGVQSNFY